MPVANSGMFPLLQKTTFIVGLFCLIVTLQTGAIDPLLQVQLNWCSCTNSRNCIRGNGTNGIPDGKSGCLAKPGEFCFTGCTRSAGYYNCARPFGDHVLKIVKGCQKPPGIEPCSQPYCEYYCSYDNCNEGLEPYHSCQDRQMSYKKK